MLLWEEPFKTQRRWGCTICCWNNWNNCQVVHGLYSASSEKEWCWHVRTPDSGDFTYSTLFRYVAKENILYLFSSHTPVNGNIYPSVIKLHPSILHPWLLIMMVLKKRCSKAFSSRYYLNLLIFLMIILHVFHLLSVLVNGSYTHSFTWTFAQMWMPSLLQRWWKHLQNNCSENGLSWKQDVSWWKLNFSVYLNLPLN